MSKLYYQIARRAARDARKREAATEAIELARSAQNYATRMSQYMTYDDEPGHYMQDAKVMKALYHGKYTSDDEEEAREGGNPVVDDLVEIQPAHYAAGEVLAPRLVEQDSMLGEEYAVPRRPPRRVPDPPAAAALATPIVTIGGIHPPGTLPDMAPNVESATENFDDMRDHVLQRIRELEEDFNRTSGSLYWTLQESLNRRREAARERMRIIHYEFYKKHHKQLLLGNYYLEHSIRNYRQRFKEALAVLKVNVNLEKEKQMWNLFTTLIEKNPLDVSLAFEQFSTGKLLAYAIGEYQGDHLTLTMRQITSLQSWLNVHKSNLALMGCDIPEIYAGYMIDNDNVDIMLIMMFLYLTYSFSV